MVARGLRLGAFGLSLVVLVLGSDTAWGRGRDQREEAEVLTKLGAVAPGAVETFRQATAALDTDQKERAEKLFREVLTAAPEFAPALRRLSWLASDRLEALKLAERALSLEDHEYNRMAVISANLRFDDSGHIGKARDLAAAMLGVKVKTSEALFLIANAATAARDLPLLDQAVQRMRQLAPDELGTHYFAGIAAASHEDWEVAETEILAAQRLGLPETEANALLEGAGIHSSARNWRLLRYLGYAAAAWAVGLLLLLLLGASLSRVTLSAIERQDPRSTGEPTGAMQRVRRLYAAVLSVASVYYYFSLPFVILAVLGAAGGVIYLFLMLGYIPIKIALIVGLVGLVSIWSMLRSLFIRVSDEDPGRRLTPEEAPGLFAMLREVAAAVNTPMVDKVFVTSDANAAVFERGSLLKRLTGRTERCLIIGLGLLEGMTQLQLRSILAHEFGHLNNQDTAGGSLALHVRRSIVASAFAMASGGAATWYNPAWWFFQLFHRIYLIVSQGASRLQEVLADRWAAMTAGVGAFTAGLRHVVRRSIEFDLIAKMEIDRALRQGDTLRNLFVLPPPERDAVTTESEDGEEVLPSPVQKIDTAFEAALAESGTPYDSHPPVGKRLAWVARIDGAPATIDEGLQAWMLFAAPRALQDELTADIQRRVDGR